ncbi:MAG: hypothetical protein JWM86_1959 [Thermoleophilia bacterium]|nr:hypothetical protein [Thermoleophilia bacterium]
MHDGWEYVAAAYGIAAVALVAWFWMIGTKLRRQRRAREADPRG